MRAQALLLGTLIVVALPIVAARHDQGCIPGGADPATYNTVDLSGVGAGIWYVEERDVPPEHATNPPTPGSGLAFGAGTWVWVEANGVPGPQRGGGRLPGDCFPPPPLPCLLVDSHPFEDENCGHGSDRLIV